MWSIITKYTVHACTCVYAYGTCMSATYIIKWHYNCYIIVCINLSPSLAFGPFLLSFSFKQIFYLNVGEAQQFTHSQFLLSLNIRV